MSQWTQEDVDRLNAKRGAAMPAHVGVRPGTPLQDGAGQTGATISVTAKPSKYRNVKTVVDGEKFDSKREANYWQELVIRGKAGEITHLGRQVPFALCCPDDKNPGTSVIVAFYVADFMYHDASGVRHIVDAKGKRTQMYALKKKWLELQSGVIIEEV